MSDPLQTLSRALYRAGKLTRNAQAIRRAVRTSSPAPILKRAVRIGLGRALGRAEREGGVVSTSQKGVGDDR